MELHYRVIIEEELKAESPKQALINALERIRNEETVSSVTCESTGEVFHFEIQTLERLDFEELGGSHGMVESS